MSSHRGGRFRSRLIRSYVRPGGAGGSESRPTTSMFPESGHLHSELMRIAHVRVDRAPAGSPHRLAAALPDGRWLDAEHARRRLIRADSSLEHNDPLFRERITTLDALLGRGIRMERLRLLVEPFLEHPDWLPAPSDEESDLVLEVADVRFGPPLLAPLSLRDFYAFERHVSTVWARRGGEVPEALVSPADLLLLERLGDPRARRRRLGAIGFERARLRVGDLRADRYALSGPSRGSRGGGDRRLHDPQRLVCARPAARRDGGPPRSGQGKGFRLDDRAVVGDARRVR